MAEGLEQLEQRLTANPQDVELYWMKARFLYELGEPLR